MPTRRWKLAIPQSVLKVWTEKSVEDSRFSQVGKTDAARAKVLERVQMGGNGSKPNRW